MKLIEANLLIYAANARAPKHERAREWLNRTLSATETVALPWVVLLAFVRITTNPKIMVPPLDSATALGYVEEWLALECVTVPVSTKRHVALLGELLAATGFGENLVTDAHLAALAIEHGATLCSCDSDFARFPGLEWTDPIA